MKQNKIDKAKSKAKGKVAAKVAKAGKTAAKAASALALVLAIAGCASTGEQPARSQTMHNDFRDCVIIANARTVGVDTKARTVDADADTQAAPLELWTQTQANEGSETISPTAKPTNTTDVDAALDVPVNKANSGTSAAGGAAEKLLGAGAGWLSGKISGTAPDLPATLKDAQGDCADGSCADDVCSECTTAR